MIDHPVTLVLLVIAVLLIGYSAGGRRARMRADDEIIDHLEEIKDRMRLEREAIRQDPDPSQPPTNLKSEARKPQEKK